jgi:hypothetical protein
VAAPDEPPFPGTEGGPAFVGYAEFGRRFFESAVTRERIEQAVAGLAGRPVDAGPNGVGPMKLVRVRATGALGEPQVRPLDDPEFIAHELLIPIDLDLVVELGLDKNRFTAAVVVRLRLTARAAEPLLVVVDIDPPTAADVEVQVEADGLRASVLQAAGRLDGELKKAVAKAVAEELAKPDVRRSRVIDVAAALDRLGRD